MIAGILGNGSVGKSLGTLLAGKGVKVLLGARSHEGKDYAEGIQPTSLEEACNASDIVISAMPWSIKGKLASLSVLKELPLTGKTVVDLTNPLDEDWAPLYLGIENSAGEETAKALPESHVVKAFNTIFADMMDADRMDSLAAKPAGFYCGSSQSAKEKVSQLIAAAGLDPIDAGDIDASRYLEQIAHFNIRLALSAENGTQAAFSYHRLP